jgi:hypothetical protein
VVTLRCHSMTVLMMASLTPPASSSIIGNEQVAGMGKRIRSPTAVSDLRVEGQDPLTAAVPERLGRPEDALTSVVIG